MKNTKRKSCRLSSTGFSLWRSGRDSNPRYAFDVHTISSRARYDRFDTTPSSVVRGACTRFGFGVVVRSKLDYYIRKAHVCQLFFSLFPEFSAPGRRAREKPGPGKSPAPVCCKARKRQERPVSAQKAAAASFSSRRSCRSRGAPAAGDSSGFSRRERWMGG